MQKTAYEMRISDWSSDVCSSDLVQMLGLGVFAAVAVVGASWAAMNGALDNQQARNQRLQGEIKEMDQKIKEIEDLERVKSNLLARMRVIENLQANRSATVH